MITDEVMRKVLQELKTCANELCLKCGKYHDEHMGACDGCRWLKLRRGW